MVILIFSETRSAQDIDASNGIILIASFRSFLVLMMTLFTMLKHLFEPVMTSHRSELRIFGFLFI